jgi:CheY-like chemotaxis protein
VVCLANFPCAPTASQARQRSRGGDPSCQRCALKGSRSDIGSQFIVGIANRVSTSLRTYVAVVDDDQSFSRSLDRLLRAAGFHSVTYRTAEDFLHDKKRPQFDCLVLDIKLPGISGIELQSQLKAEAVPTPVIFVTSHDSRELQMQAQDRGCLAYFRKTDPGDALIDSIRRLARPSPPKPR